MRFVSATLAIVLPILLSGSCFDSGERYLTEPQPALAACKNGEKRCTNSVQHCSDGKWVDDEDCFAQGLICVPGSFECKTCIPSSSSCDGQTIMHCDATGDSATPGETCKVEDGEACRVGNCVDLCAKANSERSNVGCEYWPVDLDNANVGAGLNAAGQQFAVVISNPQPDVSVKVSIDQDDTEPGDPGAPINVATATIPPLSLRVFKLGPREVDGSPSGEFNTGTHTALTRHAYRVQTDFPVVAYQFNPLDNVAVFSNDASLLRPTSAVSVNPGILSPSYVVIGWPQTIATSDDPNTNFNPNDPIDLRAFLTIVGTEENTKVVVETTTRIIAGGPIPETPVGGTLEMTLGPFDVLNLETANFNADFTGTLISADQPVVVYSGTEASDAPTFQSLSDRRCCADHLEEQIDPIRTSGKHFVASISANRSQMVANAGATIGAVQQSEYFRVMAMTNAGANVTTTLGGDFASFKLDKRGSFAELSSVRPFLIDSDQPVQVMAISASQDEGGIPSGLPGGDPSMLIIPPNEQFRENYVFLTPDRYAFDLVRVIATPDTTVVMDGVPILDINGCAVEPGDGLSAEERGSPTPPWLVYRCQLGFPTIDVSGENPVTTPGVQDDGVHRVDADRPVGVLVDGFDAFVSYGYAAGTDLVQIVPE
jgi:hypothetical protein